MPTREHLLDFWIPSLKKPIEAAHRALSLFQVWPPQLPPQIEELRRAYEKRLKEVQETQAGETVGVGIGGGSMEWPHSQTTP